MEEKRIFGNRRVADPYIDRRSGEDRRKVYDAEYWESGGIERRSAKERRRQIERRSNYVNISKWSSIYLKEKENR